MLFGKLDVLVKGDIYDFARIGPFGYQSTSLSRSSMGNAVRGGFEDGDLRC
jgi:hypothetical protein